MSPLISVAELSAALESAKPPILLDVRWRPTGPYGLPDYWQGHLPGAVFLDLDRELAGPPGVGGRHPMPDLAVFETAMRRAGVRNGHPVVVYDDGPGTAAARAWWLLRWAGHDDVRLLDGGWAAWKRADLPLPTDLSQPAPGDFTANPGQLPLLDAGAAAEVAAEGVLLDARAPERFRGEVEPFDPVAGHIPGAVNAPTTANIDVHGHLLPARLLRERFEALGVDEARPVATYCGSGVTAAHTVLALEVAGLPGALYVGSWSDWVSDPSRPVATGE